MSLGSMVWIGLTSFFRYARSLDNIRLKSPTGVKFLLLGALWSPIPTGVYFVHVTSRELAEESKANSIDTSDYPFPELPIRSFPP